MTAISAMLNSSGENAVSAKRPCALNSAIITVDRAGKGEIGQHQAGIRRRRAASVSCPANPGASAAMTSGINRPSNADDHDQRRADGAEHAPGEGGRRRCAIGFAHAQPCRHQRRIQRALGQQPP